MLALVLELDFLVVDAPRQQHRAVDPDEIVAGEVVGRGAMRRGGLDPRSAGERVRVFDNVLLFIRVATPSRRVRRPRNRSIILL